MTRSQKENSFRLRLFIFTLAAVLFFVVAIVRIAFLQIAHGAEYSEAIKGQIGTSEDTEILSLRGTIYDRNGQVLAQSSHVYNVIIDPKILQDASPVDQQYTIKELSDILRIKDDALLTKYLDPSYKSSRYELFSAGRGVSESVNALIEQRIAEGVIKGVWMEEIQERKYPGNELAAHVIGFNEAYGLELYYNEELSGTSGRRMTVQLSDGSYSTQVVEPINGKNLITTLDRTTQYYLETALADAMQEQKCRQACGILMNPKTGEIYAMAGYPSFDLNNVEKVIGITSKYTQEELKADSFLPSIWNNPVISSTYEPGSTYKPVFASSALDCGAISEYDEFLCEAVYDYYDIQFKCAFYFAHGVQTIREIIQNSCNVGMIQVSQRITTDEYCAYQDAYGIGHRTGIDLPGEVSAKLLVYGKNTMGPVERATASFGQGFNLTPIQLITAVSACVNNGYLVKPHIVSGITDAEGNLLKDIPAQVVRQVISPETSGVIRDGMEAVVENEPGIWGELEGYHIGGKTGTAEKDYDEKKYVVSFIGFAPIEDPEIGLLIVLDEADDGTSAAAQKVAAKVLKKTLPYLNLYPED
ncbi:MAG: penicillin-binding protein 2 [Firmicutes bacterium]|nr:penicillin-binding protein 2 [Bacillota bacterium]